MKKRTKPMIAFFISFVLISMLLANVVFAEQKKDSGNSIRLGIHNHRNR